MTRPQATPTRPRPPTRFPAVTTAPWRAARHHRHARSVIAALLIVASLVGLRAEHRRNDALRDAWGRSVTVWTAAADLDAGHVLTGDDLVARSLPPAALPDDPATDAPHGHRLVDAVGRGEILRVGRIQGDDPAVDGSRVATGRGGIALSAPAPHLELGDRVDLYGLLDGDRVAAGARVVDLTDGVPVVTVADHEIGAVIRAFTTGDVVPVLTG